MKKLLIVFLSVLCLASFGQTTSMSFTAITTASNDLKRANAGSESWKDMNYADIPVAGIHSKQTAAYFRFEYTDIQKYNATQHQYDFTTFDQKINAAIDNGQTFSFGIQQMCTICTGGNGNNQSPGFAAPGGSFLYYPLWLHTAMQTEAVKDKVYNGQWWQNYRSSIWKAAWAELQTVTNTHIMNGSHSGVWYRDVVRYIDVSGYGNFGEYTNNQAVIGSAQEPTIADLEFLIDATVDAFPNFQTVLQIAVFDAKQATSNTNIDAEVGWYGLTKTNVNGLKCGIRMEALGNADPLYPHWTVTNPTVLHGLNFGTEISNRWQTNPRTGEPCNCGDDYSLLPGQMTSWHFLSFGNGNQYSPSSTIDANYRAAAKAAGYRLRPNGGSTTTTLTTGGALAITVNWRNDGVTPTYDHWHIIFELVNGTTVLWRDSSSFDPYLFLPTGSDFVVTDNFTLSGVPAVTGATLRMRVQDPKKFMPAMPLYITTAQNADGSYNLRTNITITNPGGTATANAGTDQSVTIPTTSVTLDGTGSTGTITSRLWTRVSGPNTPTIVSPASATTSVTGMIAGTYVFQLSVNGGASVDLVTILVNPLIPPSPSIFTTQVPLATTDNDNLVTVGTEKGVRFQSSVAGYITGIRFYKTVGNDGVHIGELYTNTGTLLASATFVNETATGWQTVSISPAIPIAANTTYVAAYFSSLGNYVEDNFYFYPNGVTNSNLMALIDGLAGASANPDLTKTANGPYIDTSTPAFPTFAYKAANYWVDIVFSITTPGTSYHHKAHINKFIPDTP